MPFVSSTFLQQASLQMSQPFYGLFPQNSRTLKFSNTAQQKDIRDLEKVHPPPLPCKKRESSQLPAIPELFCLMAGSRNDKTEASTLG